MVTDREVARASRLHRRRTLMSAHDVGWRLPAGFYLPGTTASPAGRPRRTCIRSSTSIRTPDGIRRGDQAPSGLGPRPASLVPAYPHGARSVGRAAGPVAPSAQVSAGASVGLPVAGLPLTSRDDPRPGRLRTVPPVNRWEFAHEALISSACAPPCAAMTAVRSVRRVGPRFPSRSGAKMEQSGSGCPQT
jgi:hypothetical protein